MENFSHRLMLGCSATALMLSFSAAAYSQEATETVIVSSTRLQNAGFDAPTPTTVVGAADIEKNAQPSVFEAVTQLPALQGSTGVSYNTGSTTTGLMGLSSLNLRGLGVLRTLTLLDSQRVVAGNPNGAVDISQLPQMLIQRVDVVTGGASASWGSDAVAGVVNFVTDKRYEGFKANVFGGETTFGDDANLTAQFAAGTSFLGGRGHIEVAGEYSTTAGVEPNGPIDKYFGQKIYPGGRDIFSLYGNTNRGTAPNSITAIPGQATCGTTNTCPSQIVYGYYAQNQLTTQPYGIVTTGALTGTTFVNGMAAQFNYAGGCTPGTGTGVGQNGTAVGSIKGSINGTCFGNAADPGDQTHGWTHTLIDPLTRGNVYTRLSYELTPGTEIYATVNLSTSRTQDIPAQGNSSGKTVPFHCDNAFLPATDLFGVNLTGAQTQAACLALYPTNSFNVGESSANIPVNQVVDLTRDQRRFVVGGTGGFSVFGTDWGWDSYYEHGEGSVSIRIQNMPLKNRFNFAQDAIFDPTANNGAGGIVCRDAGARANGCVPYDPFTTSYASEAAIGYIDNQLEGSRVGGPFAQQSMTQDAFSLNFTGQPLELWAGKLSVATGFDYRQEKFWQRADPYAGGITSSSPATVYQPCVDVSIDCVAPSASHVNIGNWNAGNYTSGQGNYHVWELYTEVGVPLLDSPEFGKVGAELAGRFERYSTAGDTTTWKVGLTWETPLNGVRLRALQSRDVRAPNLADLFMPPGTLNGSFNNRFSAVGGVIPAAGLGEVMGQTNAGNPLLLPEKGSTTEVGIVFQPDWLPGFQSSIDYYRIAVKGIISASGPQTVEDLCFQGLSQYCSQQFITTKNGLPQTTTPGNQGLIGEPNQVVAIVAVPFNTAGLLTDGFDIEAAYSFDLNDYDVPGTFLFRELANRTSKFLSDPGVAGQFTTEKAGVLGGGFNSDQYNANTGNVLTWKVDSTQNWQGEKWGFNLTERYMAGGVFNGKWTNANNPLSITGGDPGLHYVTCTPGSCPLATPQMPTINFQAVPSVLYLDIGGSYQWTEKTQVYFKVDNVANQVPPNTGGNEVNNTLYDVIGRMYRVGIRFSD